MTLFKANQKGFSLLESIMAMGVILIGITAIVTLTISSTIFARITSNEFVAANLAREAVEAVRQTRDSNWLAFDTDSTTEWNEGLYDLDLIYDYEGVYFPTYPAQNWRLSDVDSPTDICSNLSAQTWLCSRVWLSTSTNAYFQVAESTLFDPTLPDLEETDFTRMVYLYPICRNIADEDDEQVLTGDDCVTSLGAGFEQVGINVIVDVEWPAGSDIAKYTVEEKLYNWKY